MDWSPQQEEALRGIQNWLRLPLETAPQIKRLFGFAGTGKSTLAQEINAMVHGEALPCAFTGKAASVMARKGLPNASTVHRLIYTPVGDGKQRVKELEEELRLLERVEDRSEAPHKRIMAVRRSLDEARRNQGPQFVLKEASAVQNAPLVILDECSMVGDRMAEDLLSFGTRVLVLGDPAQLPPVRGTGYFIEARPDYMLTEVHRQAKGDPIIDIATRIREGLPVPAGTYGQTRVIDGRIGAEDALSHDQVLTGTNARRRSINLRHRELAGHSGLPKAGERIVCLKNNHTLGLLNGTLWDLQEDCPEPDEGVAHIRIVPEEGGAELGVPVEVDLFEDDSTKLPWGAKEQFTYGYCLTVHKSQGSQWDEVLLFDDWPRPESKRNWLYTGVTRAANRLTLVRGS